MNSSYCNCKLVSLFMPLLFITTLIPLLATAGVVGEIENYILTFSYQLESWLDMKKRPCDDFYGFVCGRTQNITQQRLIYRKQEQQAKFDKFMALDEDHDDQLMDSELKLKKFYIACKTARTVEDLKSSHLYRMSSGWPAIDDSAGMLRKRRNITWLNVLGNFHDVGLEYFFRFRVEMKSNKRVVRLELDENKRYTLRMFEQLATDVMKEYAVEEGRARLVALEILSFERSRRDIIKNFVEDGDFEGSYVDFKSRLFGSEFFWDWDGYFKKQLGKTLKESDMVLVLQLPKIKQLFELLEKTSITRLLNWLWIDYLMDKSSNECQTLAATYFEPVYQHIVQRSTLDKVQMAKLYTSLGRSYEQLLPATSWIDEMTQQNSKQFLSRIIHLTLNGDAKLDVDYAALTITKRNFYRNLEKCQRFHTQRQKQSIPAKVSSIRNANAASEFLKVFLNINALPKEQNLTAPLNYILVGETFAQHMIAAGSSGNAPGSWRSMDSEREFDSFQQCIEQQQHQSRGTISSTLGYNINDLVLKMLAQAQTLHSFNEWYKQQNAVELSRIDNRLAGSRTQFSLRKLYFIGSVFTDCQRDFNGINQRDFINAYLSNSPDFTRAFACHSGDTLYTRNECKVF